MGLDRYAFVVEYNDTQAALVRQYQLLIYLTDKTIEMPRLQEPACVPEAVQLPGHRAAPPLHRRQSPLRELRSLFIQNWAERYGASGWKNAMKTSTMNRESRRLRSAP